jgi:hypothetical protein
MSTFVFREPGGISPLVHQEIEKLRRLANDLERIASGQGPIESELQAAPLLSGYWRASRPVPCLMGRVEGHPSIFAKMATTSDLWAIAPEHRWARTYSRWYRLGQSEGELAAQHGTDGDYL